MNYKKFCRARDLWNAIEIFTGEKNHGYFADVKDAAVFADWLEENSNPHAAAVRADLSLVVEGRKKFEKAW